MDEKSINVEKLAPEILLKRGVNVPVTAPLFLRLFGKKKINLTLYHPTSRTLLIIAKKYLRIANVNVDDITVSDAVCLYAFHGRLVHQCVSLGFLNNPWTNWLNKPLAWWLDGKLKEQHWLYLYDLIIEHGGVQDFLATIRLIKVNRITKPMNLSPTEKTS